MSKLRCTISLSLDGFVAGPNQSLEHGPEGGVVNDLVRTVATPDAVHLEFVRR